MSVTQNARPVLLLTPDEDAATRRLSEHRAGVADDVLLARARVRLHASSDEELVARWRLLQDFTTPDRTPSTLFPQ